MSQTAIRDSALLRTLADLFADFSDLVQKELQLARAELAENVARQLRAPLWMAVGGVTALFAGMAILEAIILGIAAAGLPLPWSCLLVGVVLAIIAGITFYAARASAARASLTPTRSARQLSQTLKTVKEQVG